MGFIPLDKDEEESLIELYSLHKYAEGVSDALKIVEETLGKVHKVSCEIRKALIIEKHYKEIEKYNQKESSNRLQSKLSKRLD